MTQLLNTEEEEEAALVQIMRSAKENRGQRTRKNNSSYYAGLRL